jgi:Type I restriction modification DNA specificity domain
MKTKNTVEISHLFDVGYGTKLDFKQLQTTSTSDVEGVCFVSRSSKNLGVVARVKKYKGVKPLPAGTITVALGGSYLLSAFVQEQPFYTAQNVAVLTPKEEMSYDEKVFYCLCLGKNRFKYSAFGREANRTLKSIEVPTVPPRWLRDVEKSLNEDFSAPLSKMKPDLHAHAWKWYRYDQIFEIERGRGPRKQNLKDGNTPFITSTDQDNGLTGFTDAEATHSANVITVARNGSVGESFYQDAPFCSTEDVHIFNPKFDLNKFIALFLIPLIKKEKYRYNYGRKWGISRMRESLIKLPAAADGKPDWQFMEEFIKGLPYSSSALQ